MKDNELDKENLIEILKSFDEKTYCKKEFYSAEDKKKYAEDIKAVFEDHSTKKDRLEARKSIDSEYRSIELPDDFIPYVVVKTPSGSAMKVYHNSIQKLIDSL